ncbi:helix-turn-helix domain-containing protein [Streptomyces collinus]|uniref:helix-turn-helix domain-containing protein n=1 Tax=Streptomyces collinus TaxID=42684 RepID=UPI0036BB09B9
MLLASAGGNRVPVIAQLVQADEDTVRDVIHRFNEIGLACLDPQCGRPSPPTQRWRRGFVIATATTRPVKLGQPFTRWSLRKLVAYLRKVHGRVIRISRGVTVPARPPWHHLPAHQDLEGVPGSRARHQAGPHRGGAGRCWTASRTGCSPSTSSDRSGSGPPRARAGPHMDIPTGCRPPTTTHGVRNFHGCHSVGDDSLWGVNRCRKAPGRRWPH